MGGKGLRWYAGLLRGVNVGGHHRLPMADLAAIATDAGAANVATYIQSGNVVFQAPPARLTTVTGAIIDGIEARHGFRVPIVVRSIDELRAVAANNPFPTAEPRWLHVGYFASTPAASAVAELDPKRFAPDVFAIRGREVYFHYPNGMGRSKLTLAYFKRLGTECTVRNWNTLQALIELAS
jgi:uncharacterized protein (DUF1697 family)